MPSCCVNLKNARWADLLQRLNLHNLHVQVVAAPVAPPVDPQTVTAAAHAIAVAAMQQLSAAPLADASKQPAPAEGVSLGGDATVPLPAAPTTAAAAAATAAAALGQLAAALASQAPQVVQAPTGMTSC